MSLLYFKMDRVAIQNYLEERVAKTQTVQTKANQVVASLFGRAHQALMKNFLEHPVTLELKAGSDASNISNTLNEEGNLFTFCGFFEGTDPTEELEQLLTRINFEKSSTKKNIIYYRITNYPSKTQISDVTQMTWANTSWAYAIETGNFNGAAALSHYIFKTWAGSRSGRGLQIPDEYSEESFKPTPYLSEILGEFQDRINNSRSKFVV
jgi:hypothetical protein